MQRDDGGNGRTSSVIPRGRGRGWHSRRRSQRTARRKGVAIIRQDALLPVRAFAMPAPDANLLQLLQALADTGEPLSVRLDRKGWRVQLVVTPVGAALAAAEPLAAEPAAAIAEPSDAPPPAGWASGPLPKHTDDFALVYWPGLGIFRFAGMQARIVARLWQDFEERGPGVSQRQLLLTAGSDSSRLPDLFRRSPAWRVLIVKGLAPATYRLAPLPGAAEGDDTR